MNRGRRAVRGPRGGARGAWRGPRSRPRCRPEGPRGAPTTRPRRAVSALAVAGVDRHQMEAVAAAADHGRRPPSGCQSISVWSARAGELTFALAVARPPGAARRSRCAPRRRRSAAVGRPRRLVVVHAGGAVSARTSPPRERGHADLAAVEIGARVEDVRHLAAVGRHRGLALVAVLLEVAGGHGQPPRPGVVARHHCQPGGLAALHARSRAGVVVDPAPGSSPPPAGAPGLRRSARGTRVPGRA